MSPTKSYPCRSVLFFFNPPTPTKPNASQPLQMWAFCVFIYASAPPLHHQSVCRGGCCLHGGGWGFCMVATVMVTTAVAVVRARRSATVYTRRLKHAWGRLLHAQRGRGLLFAVGLEACFGPKKWRTIRSNECLATNINKKARYPGYDTRKKYIHLKGVHNPCRSPRWRIRLSSSLVSVSFVSSNPPECILV